MVTGVGSEIKKEQWQKLSNEQRDNLAVAQSKSNFAAAALDSKHILSRTKNLYGNMKSLSNGLGDDYVIFVDYDFKAEEQEKPVGLLK
jgi:hypothetical protein